MSDAQTDWITVAQAAALSGYSMRTIQKLLETGKIAGMKPGHDWLTTLEAILEYKSKVRQGRPPKSKS